MMQGFLFLKTSPPLHDMTPEAVNSWKVQTIDAQSVDETNRLVPYINSWVIPLRFMAAFDHLWAAGRSNAFIFIYLKA